MMAPNRLASDRTRYWQRLDKVLEDALCKALGYDVTITLREDAA